ncbi:MAG: hypothetical protein MUP97_01725, partial [Acidimicrobiia bacterium]|nr:hypothetical protein [Acidimicrobiia bacterium]
GDAAPVPFVAFDLGEGGVLCAACSHLGGRRTSSETLAVVQRIGGGQVRGVLDDPPPEAVLREVERLAIAALEYASDRRLRSAALL